MSLQIFGLKTPSLNKFKSSTFRLANNAHRVLTPTQVQTENLCAPNRTEVHATKVKPLCISCVFNTHENADRCFKTKYHNLAF